jgi:hypothetical protein
MHGPEFNPQKKKKKILPDIPRFKPSPGLISAIFPFLGGLSLR